MLEYTMLAKVTSMSAGVKNAFLCLIKRDCITINGVDDYYSKGMSVNEIQTNISKVMEALEKKSEE